MKVSSLAWPWVATVAVSEPLHAAVWRMREFDTGSVCVVDGTVLVGIVTERDLLRAASEGVSPRSVTVRDYMSYDPVTVSADEDVTDAAAVMIAVGARHVPVLDADEVVGMLSIRDLLPYIADGKVADLARRRATSGRRMRPMVASRKIPEAR